MVYPRICALHVNSVHVLTLDSQSIPQEGKELLSLCPEWGPLIPVSWLGTPSHLLLPRALRWVLCSEPWALLLRPDPVFSARYRSVSPLAAKCSGDSALHPSGARSHRPHGTLWGTAWWGSSPGGPVPQAGSRPAPGPAGGLCAAPFCSAGSPCEKEGRRRRLVDSWHFLLPQV